MTETLLIIILGIISIASLGYLGYVINNFFKYFLKIMNEVTNDRNNNDKSL